MNVAAREEPGAPATPVRGQPEPEGRDWRIWKARADPLPPWVAPSSLAGGDANRYAAAAIPRAVAEDEGYEGDEEAPASGKRRARPPRADLENEMVQPLRESAGSLKAPGSHDISYVDT